MKEQKNWAIGWVNCDNCGGNVPCAKRYKAGHRNALIQIRPPLCPNCGVGYRLSIRPDFYTKDIVTAPEGTLLIFFEEELKQEK